MTTTGQHPTFPDGILAQHAHLSKMVGDLRKAHARGAPWPELAALLDELLERVRQHFGSEEDQMEQAVYPKLASHRELHRTFMRRLELLRAECDRRQTELMATLTKSLESWFANHERTADKDALEFLGLLLPGASLRPPKTPSEN